MTLHFAFIIFSFYLEKYLQLEQKFEDLSRENLNLKTRIEAVEENRDIKDQPQSEGIKITSHHRDDYTDNETNTNTIENDHSYNVENWREKDEYYESHPDLETMADAVKSNSDLKETTTNKVNENPKHGISKEKRLLIDSGNNIIYPMLKFILLSYTLQVKRLESQIF